MDVHHEQSCCYQLMLVFSLNVLNSADAFLFRPSVPRFDHLVSVRA
jgi:hypothetical protein